MGYKRSNNYEGVGTPITKSKRKIYLQKQKQTTSNSIIHDPKAAQDGNKWQKKLGEEL